MCESASLCRSVLEPLERRRSILRNFGVVPVNCRKRYRGFTISSFVSEAKFRNCGVDIPLWTLRIVCHAEGVICRCIPLPRGARVVRQGSVSISGFVQRSTKLIQIARFIGMRTQSRLTRSYCLSANIAEVNSGTLPFRIEWISSEAIAILGIGWFN